MFDLFRWYLAGVLGSVLFWFGVGAMTPAEEPTITDAPYRALTAMNMEWMGVDEADAADWERYKAVVGEASAHWRATKESLGGDEQKPADWPEGYDWPYDHDKTFSPAAPAFVKEAGVRAVDACRDAGLFARLAEARATLRPVRVYGDVETPIIDALHHEMGWSRGTARLLAMRMALAAEGGDEADFVAALKDAHWVGHAAGQSMLIGAFVDVAIHSFVLREVRHALKAHQFSDATLAEIDTIVAAFAPRAAVRHGFRGERQMQADFVQRTHTDGGDGGGHFVWSPFAHEYLDPANHPVRQIIVQTGPWSAFFFGSRRGNELAFDELLADSFRALDTPSARDAVLHSDEIMEAWGTYRFPLIGLLLPATGSSVRKCFLAHAEHHAARILVALERHRLKHGRDADTLEALVPHFLPALPTDTISGEAWVYKRLDATDEHGRTFLLYSVGLDGTDNAGKHSLDAATAPIRGAGLDYVINTLREW